MLDRHVVGRSRSTTPSGSFSRSQRETCSDDAVVGPQGLRLEHLGSAIDASRRAIGAGEDRLGGDLRGNACGDEPGREPESPVTCASF